VAQFYTVGNNIYERPHESLNDLPPKIYEQQLT